MLASATYSERVSLNLEVYNSGVDSWLVIYKLLECSPNILSGLLPQ